MTDEQIERLGAQIVKALAGPLRAVIESKRREQSAAFTDRVITEAELVNFLRSRFSYENGESKRKFL
jgi:hypothetical protein